MNRVAEQTLKVALSLVAAAVLFQWTWRLIEPLMPVFVVLVALRDSFGSYGHDDRTGESTGICMPSDRCCGINNLVD